MHKKKEIERYGGHCFTEHPKSLLMIAFWLFCFISLVSGCSAGRLLLVYS